VTAPWRNRLIGLAIAVAIYGLDRWIKTFVSGPLQLRQVRVIELLPFFDLRWTENIGVSLGMFEASSIEMRWILVGVTGLIACVVFVWLLREKLMAEIAGLAMILGGALGNIYDRFTYGYVIDYADLHFGDFRPFLIFNLADAMITFGVLIILARALFMREKPAASQAQEPTEHTAEPTAENS